MSRQDDLVLVVDDDEDFRALVRALLEHVGYRVEQAESGEDALKLIEADAPALVILDIRLPGLNGYEVCRRIRDRFDGEVAIVFVSGNRTESYDRSAGLLIGADDYIVKPFDASEFVARLRRLAPLNDLRENGNGSRIARLTPRELEVLRLLAEGHDQDDIAEQLVISPKTVSTHIQRILGKLEVRSRAQAVALALHERAASVARAH